jgi:hypothetical protein
MHNREVRTMLRHRPLVGFNQSYRSAQHVEFLMVMKSMAYARNSSSDQTDRFDDANFFQLSFVRVQ